MFKDIELTAIDAVMQRSWNAFVQYRTMPLAARAAFMKNIALEIEACGDELLVTAMQETNLPEARLRSERARTIFQLNSYADACLRGEWMEIRIDTAVPDKNPPKPDLRKMMLPLGPVLVFGSSNFPFAYSTAGGDTGSAFAAGCPVIVKAHPAHAQTSELVAGAVMRAAAASGMPDGIFAHVHGAASAVGEALVKHHLTKAVGFTGSYAGGKQLFDWGNQRKEPIPVFAEMGSVNPVFLLPAKLTIDAAAIAKTCAASITLGVGQFCTNPGIIIGIKGTAMDIFCRALKEEIEKIPSSKMLHKGIAKNFAVNKEKALSQDGVQVIAESVIKEEGYDAALSANAVIATVTAEEFLLNPQLHQEVFGPYSIVVKCSSPEQMQDIADSMEGQLTSTLMATEEDITGNAALVDAIRNRCGRFILNGVPTGVEVCLSMQHGGPFPATTDSRFTSVGADGIKRFGRPVAYQNWPDNLLPDELKKDNPLQLWRTINDVPGLH
ncbi:MAG: aldehyde dehydrogenase (NADP(+)) [Ferruginibacter sp.]